MELAPRDIVSRSIITEINEGRGFKHETGVDCMKMDLRHIGGGDKGKKTSEDIDRVGQAVKKQIDTMMALGNVGKFVLSDMVERLVAGVNGEYTGAAKSGGEDEYREFLKSELARLDAKKEKQD